MILIPTLGPQQIEDLKSIRHNEGFKIIVQSIEHTIKVNNASLANWDFKFYEAKELDGKEEFKKVQQETVLLKSFLQFINNCSTLASGQKVMLANNNDVYS